MFSYHIDISYIQQKTIEEYGFNNLKDNLQIKLSSDYSIYNYILIKEEKIEIFKNDSINILSKEELQNKFLEKIK